MTMVAGGFRRRGSGRDNQPEGDNYPQDDRNQSAENPPHDLQPARNIGHRGFIAFLMEFRDDVSAHELNGLHDRLV